MQVQFRQPKAPSGPRLRKFNKYGHLSWKESRPENAELRQANEAARKAKQPVE